MNRWTLTMAARHSGRSRDDHPLVRTMRDDSGSLDGSVVVITSTGATLHGRDTHSRRQAFASPTLFVSLGTTVARLQGDVPPGTVLSRQAGLPFPRKNVRSQA